VRIPQGEPIAVPARGAEKYGSAGLLAVAALQLGNQLGRMFCDVRTKGNLLHGETHPAAIPQ
jgi:hypothetical protein